MRGMRYNLFKVPPKDSPKLLVASLVVIAMFGVAIFVVYSGKEAREIATSPSSTARIPKTYTAYYEGGVFSPSNLRIHAGDSVKFQNDSTSSDIYVTADQRSGLISLKALDSGINIKPGSSYVFKFERSGSYAYKNKLAKNEIGTIIVRP